jgi:hypothetical protein
MEEVAVLVVNLGSKEQETNTQKVPIGGERPWFDTRQ